MRRPLPSVFSARRGPIRIVAIGGGTGLSILLSGLKQYARPALRTGKPIVDITAVVTVTDDGGSSGRLRRDFDVLPPGDIRNCMAALCEEEAMLARLFNYRFAAGHGLKGHSFGNLFLTALTHITGDFAHAVSLSSEILAICGKIYPSTAANVELHAELENGLRVSGESKISKSRSRIKRITLSPRRCDPVAETLTAIDQADLITLGPGSLFTSIIPNLLVNGIPEAIAKSKAVKAYFCNLMWQPGETVNFSASEHVEAILRHSRKGLLDYAVVNTQPITPGLLERYAYQRSLPVENDYDRMEKLGVKILGEGLLLAGEKVRHNPQIVAAIALKLARLGRKRILLLEKSEKTK